MKYAFISLNDKVHSYDHSYLGGRVLEVHDNKTTLVDVEDLYFWVECADDVNITGYYYDPNDKQIKLQPVKPQ